MFINSLQTELKITYSKNLIQLNPSILITLGFCEKPKELSELVDSVLDMYNFEHDAFIGFMSFPICMYPPQLRDSSE